MSDRKGSSQGVDAHDLHFGVLSMGNAGSSAGLASQSRKVLHLRRKALETVFWRCVACDCRP